MVYNGLLYELKNKLIDLIKEEASFVSIGFSSRGMSINNIVKAEDVLIADDCISICADDLHIDFNINDRVDIAKNYYGFESGYIITNDGSELYIDILGT